ncbi:MAG TPA: hypothetical protein VGO07_03150 [Candidatus Saccharimonadales bacterium]|nr:hypothetical protein [Candidatus Saccharimonadales bacterium]
MDPHKTPPSPDSEKPNEDVTGSTGGTQPADDNKSWGSNPSNDDSHPSDINTDIHTTIDHGEHSGDSPDTAANTDSSEGGSDTAGAPSADKVAMAGDSWNSDKSVDSSADNPVEDKPVQDAQPSTAPESSADIPAVMPVSGAGPAPVQPAWPASGAPGAVMPASAIGGAHNVVNKKGLLIALIIAVVIVVLGGGIAAAYFGYVVPNKPENVLNTALMNTFDSEKVKSEHVSGKVSVKDTASNMTLASSFTGGANSDGAFEIKADVDALVTKLTIDARSVDGSTYYLKVGGLEGLPELMSMGMGAMDSTPASAYAPIIATLNNQWVEINESILSQIGLDTGSLKMNKADDKKMADTYGKYQFLSIKEKLSSEKISGMDSYHYKVAVDKTELKNFMTGLKDAKLQSVKINQDSLTQFNDAIKNVDFSKYPIDIWITKDTKLIDQVTFTYAGKDASVTGRLTILDFNKPVNITKPTGTKSLLEVISNLYTGSGGSAALMQQLGGSGISL